MSSIFSTLYDLSGQLAEAGVSPLAMDIVLTGDDYYRWRDAVYRENPADFWTSGPFFFYGGLRFVDGGRMPGGLCMPAVTVQ